ncbi:MAG: hypothetical protein AAF391_02420 [Bacteroidota bacterium]
MKNLLFTSLLCSALFASAQEWKLVYENDREGNAVNGNLTELMTFVKSGEVIRIGWGSSRVTHVAEASFLTIMLDSVLFAQIRPITGQTPDFDKMEIKFKENLEWSFIGGTNGSMTVMMRNVITGEILNHRTRTSSFKWFVRKGD